MGERSKLQTAGRYTTMVLQQSATTEITQQVVKRDDAAMAVYDLALSIQSYRRASYHRYLSSR